jgi:hypothetical protein
VYDKRRSEERKEKSRKKGDRQGVGLGWRVYIVNKSVRARRSSIDKRNLDKCNRPTKAYSRT